MPSDKQIRALQLGSENSRAKVEPGTSYWGNFLGYAKDAFGAVGEEIRDAVGGALASGVSFRLNGAAQEIRDKVAGVRRGRVPGNGANTGNAPDDDQGGRDPSVGITPSVFMQFKGALQSPVGSGVVIAGAVALGIYALLKLR